jgi:DNA-binding NarL/FixJ family response regulator
MESRPEKPVIRVLAADSTRMSSQLLADMLARDKRFRVLETEPTTAKILAIAESEKPHVVLLSPTLEENPTMGFQVARQLHAAYPGTRIVMLLDRSERSAAVESFRAGASGIFCRTESLKSLARCISCVHAGQVWANRHELRYLLDALSEAVPVRTASAGIVSLLSKREQDVVRGVADGLSNREIAHRLNLTEHTVKNYLFRIFDKLGVSSRVEVVLYAFGVEGSAASHLPAANPSTEIPAAPGNRTRKGPIAARSQARDASATGKVPRKALPF